MTQPQSRVIRIYVDTNVWLDFFGGESRRTQYLLRDEFAAQIFDKIVRGEYEIVLSDHLLRQLDWFVTDRRKLDALLEQLKPHSLTIRTKQEDRDLANSRVPKDLDASDTGATDFEDMLHYGLAERAKCDLFVTCDGELQFSGSVKIVASKDIC